VAQPRLRGCNAGRLDTRSARRPRPPSLRPKCSMRKILLSRRVRSAVGTRRFTLKQYLRFRTRSLRPGSVKQTPVDRPLAELGLKRRAALRIPFFVPTIRAIARTDLTLTLPRRCGEFSFDARRAFGGAASRDQRLFVFHGVAPRLTAEPAHAWFREQLRMAARTLEPTLRRVR